MQPHRRGGRFSAGRISTQFFPWNTRASGADANLGESSDFQNQSDQALSARESATRSISDAATSQILPVAAEQIEDNTVAESRSNGSPRSISSSLPSYTSDERPPYPHSAGTNDSTRNAQFSWRCRDDHRRAVEVSVDTLFEIAMSQLRFEERVRYADFHSWPEWLASVRRHNNVRRNFRERDETLEESERRADEPFEFAFGPRPAGTVPAVSPPRATVEDWDKWLESEDRWGSIRMNVLDGDTLEQAEGRADEDMEDLIGQRPFYFPFDYLYRRQAVIRPEPGSEDYIRHQSFRDAFTAAGASPDKIEEIFREFYLVDQ
ncbi:hypothetical protein VTL71DRAFT_9883 [Oculimacula yallundae]|uniref:Uncharacterized protein n=1 Tax=Oculimacula yallundae TaxID=86028 RepID=A0ABR4BSH7_9HELO